MFGLRKVNRNTHTFETTFQNWKENGEDVALLMPEFSAKWLPIAEESGSWSGWVLLGEIFPLISSELAGMAFNARNGKVNRGMAQFIQFPVKSKAS